MCDVCLCMYLFIIHTVYYPGVDLRQLPAYAHAKTYLKNKHEESRGGPQK